MRTKTITIGLIGSGNMADCLGYAFSHAGIRITEVYSRNKKSGKKLATSLQAHFAANIKDLKGDADVYFLCVPDQAIGSTIQNFPFSRKTLVHTSGGTPISIFPKQVTSGVFWPLQSVSKGITRDFSNIPVCVEAGSAKSKQQLQKLAKSISRKVITVTSEQRSKLHLAAVFANNFSNACFAIASDITVQAGLNFSLLHEMISHTAEKAIRFTPAKVQTGPAIRNDKQVMKKHKQQLRHDPELLKVYQAISNYLVHSHS